MWLRLVGLVAVVGCGAEPVRTAPIPAARPLPSWPRSEPFRFDLTAMFAVPSPPPTETRCRSFPTQAASPYSGSIIFEFVPAELGAVPRGPRVSERERRINPLTHNELQRPFARRAKHITRCWKWFAATHPGANTQLDVHLSFDEHGGTSNVAITNRPEDADLAGCIRDAYNGPLYFYPQRGVATHLVATLAFERADQPPWKKPPARPAVAAIEPLPERGTECVHTQVGVVDEIRIPYRFVVSDFDTARIPPPPPPERGHLRGRLSAPPSIRVGCVGVNEMPKKANIRAAIHSNWGAYEQCHVEARARMPDLAGDVNATLWFHENGAEPTLAFVSGAGDSELHACLDRALEEIWLDPPTKNGTVRVEWTFTLVTSPPIPVRTRKKWERGFANARSPAEVCSAWNLLVQDRLAAAPWIDDARVRATFDGIARYIHRQEPKAHDACMAILGPALLAYTGIDQTFAVWTGSDRRGDLDRLEAVKPMADVARWGPRLTWALATSQIYDPTHADESRNLLEWLKGNEEFGEQVRLPGDVGVVNDCAL